MATRSYWLVNSNRSRVKRFIENTNNKDQFFKYMFIDSGKVTSTWGKEPPVMTSREELKKDAAREEWKKFNDELGEKMRGVGLIFEKYCKFTPDVGEGVHLLDD